MPSITAEIDSCRDIIDLLVDDPDLIRRAVDDLIKRSEDGSRYRRGRSSWYDADRWRAVRAALTGPVLSPVGSDHAAIDALIDGFIRLDSLNRARALERLQGLAR